MELRNDLSSEELDKLFDNGYSYKEFLEAPPVKRAFMLGTHIKEVNPIFKMFDDSFHEIRMEKWVKIGENGENDIWYNKESDKIMIGNVN